MKKNYTMNLNVITKNLLLLCFIFLPIVIFSHSITLNAPTDFADCSPIASSPILDTDGDGLTDCEEITGLDNPNTPAVPPNDADGTTSDPANSCDPISTT